MRRHLLFTILIISFSLLTACSLFEKADARRAAERACNVDPLKDPNLEQLYCMEEKGKGIPNYASLADKIEKKKVESALEFQKSVDVCEVKDLKEDKKVITGTIVAPRTHPVAFLNEKATQVCKEKQLPQARILEIKIVPQQAKAGEPDSSCCAMAAAKAKEVMYMQEAQFECL
jgi:hypothetical protein